MFNGYAKMRLLDAFIGRILDSHQTHWTGRRRTRRILELPMLVTISQTPARLNQGPPQQEVAKTGKKSSQGTRGTIKLSHHNVIC